MQASKEEAKEIFKELLSRSVRMGLLEAMEAEVESLCGSKYRPDKSSYYYRAGSEVGSYYANGCKQAITRPRVRSKQGGEEKLSVYRAASRQKNLFEEVVSMVGQGLSMRGASRYTSKAVSKSAASRMWVEKSMQELERFRGRDLEKHQLIGMQIDGIHLGKEICLVVAVGIDKDGIKHVLDFEQGSSESTHCVEALLGRLHRRGIKEPKGRRLLIQRDGSGAINRAVKKYYPNALQQECLVHLQRNIKDKLRRKDAAELDIKFKRLRVAQGKKAGEEAWGELYRYVEERHAMAARAMLDRKEVLLSFHRLDVPATLNRTFLSTNIIENAIKNWRAHTGKVKLWNEKKDMVSRWAATGLLWSESTFNKIAHAEDLHHLEAALSFCVPASEANASSSSTTKDKEELELIRNTR